jgi:heme oxygenase-like protein
MGRGKEVAMHGPMLERLERELGLGDEESAPVWESLALSNLMLGLASHRHYAYQSLGALGVIELTAPGRCEQVNAGLRRLGIDGAARKYYAVHATIDIKHSLAWNREAIRPLVAADPSLARPIAEGALLRLVAGARCFARYRTELGVKELRVA